MKKALFLSAAFAVIAGPALAQQFYIVQDRTSKECRIVEERPADTTSVTILGNGAVFSTRNEAQSRLKEVCTDSPTTGSSTTIIKER